MLAHLFASVYVKFAFMAAFILPLADKCTVNTPR